MPYPCCCGGVQTPCCANKIPNRLIATVTGFSAACYSAFVGNDYDLNYNSGTGKWEGTIEGLTVKVYCDTDPSNTWRFDITGDAACSVIGSPFNPTQQCYPFLLQYATSSDGGSGDCCTTTGGAGTGDLIFEVTAPP